MSKQFSEKKSVKTLVDLCVGNGLREVVISPGSRNAPLIISFAAHEAIECITIVDERSAAFFALGMAQQLGRPVGLVCTSGTAVLNYAPAIAEAYYQKVPLVVITADRPKEWIDQADGQTIRQENIFSNYIKYSCSLPVELENSDDEWLANRQISEAFYYCKNLGFGPVHINVPLREPLYGKTTYPQKPGRLVKAFKALPMIDGESLENLAQQWNNLESIMILVGMQKPNVQLQNILSELAQQHNVVIVTEPIANINDSKFIVAIDGVVNSIGDEEASLFAPSLLITIEGAVTSKMIKTFLRANQPKQHWHISPDPVHPDTFRSLTASIEADPTLFFDGLKSLVQPKKLRYLETWLNRKQWVAERHQRYIDQSPWSDLKVFSLIKKYIPEQTSVHLANSTPVRYAQLFEDYNNLEFFCNRGTSGIDGCTSTAAGAAYASKKSTLLITGDLSFFYDSNALWNKFLMPNFKIIMINNGGGGIFRYLGGSSSADELDEHFEVTQNYSCEHLVKGFGLVYLSCEGPDELDWVMKEFYATNDKPVVLEIKTPRLQNAKILKEYFNNLKK